MPRNNLPEYWARFEIECNGYGNTREQAVEQLEEDMEYKLRWIRGVFDSATEIETYEMFSGSKSYGATRTLKFTKSNKRKVHQDALDELEINNRR